MIRFNDITIERDKHTIWHGAKYHTFPSSNYANGRNKDCSLKLMEALLLGDGCTVPDLFNLLYDDDPNGGPIQGRKQIDVMLHTLKPIFEKLGFVLCVNRHNSRNAYRLVSACGSTANAT